MRLTQETLSAKPLSWLNFILAFLCILISIPIVTIIFVWPVFAIYPGDKNPVVSTSFQLLSVAIWHFAIALTVWLFFKRRYFSFINPLNFKIKLEILWAVGFSVGFLISTDLFAYLFLGQSFVYELVIQPQLWLMWLLPMALIILLQSSAEEFLFRGFLQQYLAGLNLHKWIYIITPAAIWASLHFWNFDKPLLQLAAVFQVLLMGIVWAHWADRTRTLWGPIIMHFLNNFYLIQIGGNNLEPNPLQIWRANVDLSNMEIIIWFSVIMSIVHFVIYFAFIQKHLPDNREPA